MADEAQRLFREAGILPEVMPENFTFRKVRELLAGLEKRGREELDGAIKAVKKLQVRGPLSALIFVKHHLEGVHEVEVDRIDEGEDGSRYGVLTYTEGEVPVLVEYLPAGITAGSRLRYNPFEACYR